MLIGGYAVMTAFGMPPGLSVEDLSLVEGAPPTGFRFGRPPFAVDLITSVQGVAFDEAWLDSVKRNFADLEVRVIGLAALLQNKRSTGRLKDAADVEFLEQLGEL